VSAVDLEALAAAVFEIGREFDRDGHGTGRDGQVQLTYDPRVAQTHNPRDAWHAVLFHYDGFGATAEMALEALRDVALKELEEMVTRAEDAIQQRREQVAKVRGMLAEHRTVKR
jgi:hypothetical protein